MNPVHIALRDATASAHARVDALYGGFALDDRAAYAAFLAAQAEALLALEAALDTSAPALIEDWPARRRTPLIEADLADLATHPRDLAPPPALTPAAAAGTLYVLEGSRLGARFLVRSVPVDFPRRFLNADYPSRNWPKLLDTLETLLRPPPALEQAIAAAQAAFAMFEQSGERWLVKG